jgi:hypothetical protein
MNSIGVFSAISQANKSMLHAKIEPARQNGFFTAILLVYNITSRCKKTRTVIYNTYLLYNVAFFTFLYFRCLTFLKLPKAVLFYGAT